MEQNLGTGFLQGFTNTYMLQKQQKRESEMRDLQMEMLKAQKKLQEVSAQQNQAKMQAAAEFMSAISGSPAINLPADQAGPTRAAIPGLNMDQLMQRPDVIMKGVAGGQLDFGDVMKMSQQQKEQATIQQLMQGGVQGGGAIGGMNVDPVSLVAAMGGGGLGALKSMSPSYQKMIDPESGREIVTSIMPTGGMKPIGVSSLSPSEESDRTPLTPEEIKGIPGAKIGMTRGDAKKLGLTPENAVTQIEGSRIAALQQAAQNVGKVKSILVDENGAPKMAVVAGLVLPHAVQTGETRAAYSQMIDALQQRIYGLSGATAGESELKIMIDSQMPTPMDLTSPGLVDAKLKNLERYLTSSLDNMSMPDSLRKKVNASLGKERSPDAKENPKQPKKIRFEDLP
jgi:hypothetical protein